MKPAYRFRFWRRLSVLFITAAILGCASLPPPTPSLFERLGGLPALAAVTDQTINLTATDPRTRRSFQGVKLAPLKESIVSLLCQATGGPCKYQGAPMDKAHRGLQITSTEFDTMVELLATTLDQFHVAAREKNELIGLLAPMKKDIVAH